jgi:hypothetical protein
MRSGAPQGGPGAPAPSSGDTALSSLERSGLNRAGRVRDNPRVATRPPHRAAWLLGLLLVVLHLIPWGWEGNWLPWLPAELGFRIGWMLLALAYLLWFCRAVWTTEGDER